MENQAGDPNSQVSSGLEAMRPASGPSGSPGHSVLHDIFANVSKKFANPYANLRNSGFHGPTPTPSPEIPEIPDESSHENTRLELKPERMGEKFSSRFQTKPKPKTQRDYFKPKSTIKNQMFWYGFTDRPPPPIISEISSERLTNSIPPPPPAPLFLNP